MIEMVRSQGGIVGYTVEQAEVPEYVFVAFERRVRTSGGERRTASEVEGRVSGHERWQCDVEGWKRNVSVRGSCILLVGGSGWQSDVSACRRHEFRYLW